MTTHTATSFRKIFAGEYEALDATGVVVAVIRKAEDSSALWPWAVMDAEEREILGYHRTLADAKSSL